MMSFGQRLKMLRRETDISQSDLAEALGVSVQSVSKWECDNNMPDISLLLPLSAILGVTTDCLLGVGTNEKEDKEALDKEIEDIWNKYHAGNYKDNAILKEYNAKKEFLKKYPLNYDVKLGSAYTLSYFLYRARRNHYDIPHEEFETLWNEGVKSLMALIKQDRDPSRLLKARLELIEFYNLKNMWDESEAIAEEMPDVYGHDLKTAAHFGIACDKHDFPAALEYTKKMRYTNTCLFLDALYSRARRISIFGNVRKEEALEAWDDMIKAAKLCRGIFGTEDWDDYYDMSLYLIWALQMAASDNLPLGRVDKALDHCEEITDIVEETVACYKGKKSLKQEDYNKFKQLEWALHGCFDMVFEEEDNMLSREERFKKCEERIRAIE